MDEEMMGRCGSPVCSRSPHFRKWSLDARSRDHPGHPFPSNIFVLGGGEKEAGLILCSPDARSLRLPGHQLDEQRKDQAVPGYPLLFESNGS